MKLRGITDSKIFELLLCEKTIKNPGASWSNRDGHEKLNYSVEAIRTEDKFKVYLRRNKRSGRGNDFSCGIIWIAQSGEKITLKRYNGSSHNHLNELERTRIGYNSHIHTATERYIKNRLKAEGFAEITDRFQTLEDAFNCLRIDCNITNTYRLMHWIAG